MRLQLSASGMDLSDSTKIYVEDKIVGRLSKLLSPNQDEAAEADVRLMYQGSNTKDTKDKCHVTISGLGKGLTFHVETEEPDMLVAIDAASQKLEEQLRRLKEKLREHLHQGGHQPPTPPAGETAAEQ